MDSNWDGRGCWILSVTFVVMSPNCGGNASDLCWRLAISILGRGTDCQY